MNDDNPMSVIDARLKSVWSQPLGANDTRHENSLQGIVDDYPVPSMNDLKSEDGALSDGVSTSPHLSTVPIISGLVEKDLGLESHPSTSEIPVAASNAGMYVPIQADGNTYGFAGAYPGQLRSMSPLATYDPYGTQLYSGQPGIPAGYSLVPIASSSVPQHVWVPRKILGYWMRHRLIFCLQRDMATCIHRRLPPCPILLPLGSPTSTHPTDLHLSTARPSRVIPYLIHLLPMRTRATNLGLAQPVHRSARAGVRLISMATTCVARL